MPKIKQFLVPFSIPEAYTGHINRKQLDIPYANSSSAQKLDLYWPSEGNGPFPVIVSIHGGAFMGGDKRDVQIQPMLNALDRGFAVVGVNYRMSGEALFPALVQDVKAAIRWIRANAKPYMLDSNKIAVWGGSAGGYLSLMAGVTSGIDELTDLSLGNPEVADNVHAVVAWFPPTDFLKMDLQLSQSGFPPIKENLHAAKNSPESLILGEEITKIPNIVRIANPESYLRPDLPPFFIQHGTHDRTVPYQQSLNFAEKLHTLAPRSVTYELILNAEHADPAFERKHNVKKVLDFIEGVFNK